MPLMSPVLQNTMAKGYLADEVGLTDLHAPKLDVLRPGPPNVRVLVDNPGMNGATWVKYGPFFQWDPTELLAMQPNQRDRYAESYRACIVPNLRIMANIIRTKCHLCSPEESQREQLSQMFPGVDRTYQLANLRTHFYTMAVFADAWEPLLTRWEQENFELLQPHVPDPFVTVVPICGMMGVASGKLQEKLQGISSLSRAQSLMENHERTLDSSAST